MHKYCTDRMDTSDFFHFSVFFKACNDEFLLSLPNTSHKKPVCVRLCVNKGSDFILFVHLYADIVYTGSLVQH